jgi:hypothetical protein
MTKDMMYSKRPQALVTTASFRLSPIQQANLFLCHVRCLVNPLQLPSMLATQTAGQPPQVPGTREGEVEEKKNSSIRVHNSSRPPLSGQAD